LEKIILIYIIAVFMVVEWSLDNINNFVTIVSTITC